MTARPKPLVLAILDGWGLAKPGPGNAISLAHLPHITGWGQTFPHTTLQASGAGVGLPAGLTGNSEVGHLNLGAGYIVPEDVERINKAIADGSFFSNEALVAACQRANQSGRAVHILTMIGPGEVHSSIEHLWAMLELTQKLETEHVYVHLFGDGRDSSPQWLGKHAETVDQRIRSLGGQVVSLVGRYYAMDRDKRWDRTDMAYQLLVERKGGRAATLETAVHHSYAEEITDEFIKPTVIGNGRAILDGDSVVFLNFRTDRPRQLTHMLADQHFSSIERAVYLPHLYIVTMTEYEEGLAVENVAFKPAHVAHPLAKVLSDAGLTQLHASESEKYAHVTYFFNGGREAPFPGEDRLQVPSPKVATYDRQPEMSAIPLTDKTIEAVTKNLYDVVIMNYANADMVGHTGNLDATIQAVQTVDECLGRLWAAIEPLGGVLMITADHGNAEVLRTPAGEVDTQHNPNDVPLIVLGSNLPGSLKSGCLANVSPTLLQLLHIDPPKEMTAESVWVTPQ